MHVNDSQTLAALGLFFIGSFIASAVLCLVWRNLARRRQWLDVPNHRSSHKLPTPKSGGVAFALVTFAQLIVLVLWHLLPVRDALFLGLPGVAMVVLGYLDDRHHISHRIRLGLHFAIAALALALLQNLPSVSVGQHSGTGLWLYALYLPGLVWLMNLYNFMDGIDGLAASEAISVLAGAAALMFYAGDWWACILLLLLLAPVAGFLIFNRAPASLFMGDAGSGFLGLFIGSVALLISAISQLNVWSWLILLGVFLVDATWTLAVRVFSGQRWYEAHASHAYQISARKLGHRATVWIINAVNVLWLMPMAYLASLNQNWGLGLTLLAWLPLLITCGFMGAGKIGAGSAAPKEVDAAQTQ